jgi:PAS domain S-box-containing protein
MLLPGSRLPSRWFVRPVILGIAAFLILLAATGFLGIQDWHEWQAASRSVAHSRQVIETLDRVRAYIAELETEKRNYMLTLDPAYLNPYGASEEGARQEIEALQNLVADDPLQSLRAAHLALVVAAKLREVDEILNTARTSSLEAGLAIIRSMDEIRSQIDQMLDIERLLLAHWQALVDGLQQSTIWLIAAAVVIATIFAGAAFALAWLEVTRRRQATDENARLYSDLQERQAKIRRLVEADIIGIFIWDFDGRILEANGAFLHMVGYEREDLVSGRVRWADLTPPEWRDRTRRALDELRTTGTASPWEKEYFRKDGSRVPVLIGGAMFEESGHQGVSYVLDLTERKRAEVEAHESERRYREMQAELAHANRVTTMGQLTASIAHEVNQPIASAVTNAEAALRWLGAQPPDLEEVRQALGRIVKDGNRAGDIVGRIRALIKKAPPRKVGLEINEAILEVIALARGEVMMKGVSVQTQLADGLPLIEGDRVQLQQVLLNLIINAVEAMSGVSEGTRELLISSGKAESNGVLVAVQDSGPGLPPESLKRIFEAFYTTKSSGMGMGLAICRSTIEAHGGRLWVSANEPRGAVFQFILPRRQDETVPAEHAGHMPVVRGCRSGSGNPGCDRLPFGTSASGERAK